MKEIKNLACFTSCQATFLRKSNNCTIYNGGTLPLKNRHLICESPLMLQQGLSCTYLGKSEFDGFFIQRRLKQDFLSLEYVYSGAFCIRNHKHGFVAEAGELCLLHPGMDHDLLVPAHQKCSKIGMIIRGELLPEILKKLNLAQLEVIELADSSRLEKLFETLRRTLIANTTLSTAEKNSGCTFELLQMIANADHSEQPPAELRNFLEYLEAHAGENISMAQMAAYCKISISSLTKHFRNYLKSTPYQYLISLRMHRATCLLQESQLSIKEISEAVGYNNPLHFSTEFRRIYGCSPRQYRQQRKSW